MAEKRKITIHPSLGGKKIISSVPTSELHVEEEKSPVDSTSKRVERTESIEGEKTLRTKRTCHFCQSKTSPAYTDLATLKRYLTDRAKILPKLKSSVCARHQRAVAKQIKYARHLSLLPFVPKV